MMLQKVSTAFAVTAVAVLAVVALAGFRQAVAEGERPGLARYRTAAIHEVGSEVPESNAEVVVVMEARNICQQVGWLAEGRQDAAETVRAIDESVSATADAARELGESISVTEFAQFAKSRIRDTASADPTAVQEFLDSECPANIANAEPILADSH
jgi:hypothetical protein